MSAGLTEGNSTDFVSGSAGSLNANVIASQDINNYQAAYLQITDTFNATVRVQGSNDDTNFVDVLSTDISNPSAAPSLTITAPGMFYVPTAFRYFRLRITAYVSGTVSALVFFQVDISGDLGPRTVKAQLQDNAGAAVTLGQKTMANSIPVVIPSDQTITVVSSPLPVNGSRFSFGNITTASQTKAVIEKTTYTSPTTNGQRSFASSNAGDAAAGTGARTILLTYYDQTCAGPFTETITMNGVSRVNTVATNICFIESILVLTVGSNGSNLGTITMFTLPTAGGTTIATITVGDNQTFWAHHYVAAGTSCYISGFSVNNTSTAVGNGGTFILMATNPTVAGSVNRQISDFHRLYGQSSTATRTYLSPIVVVGPALIRAYVTPETNTRISQRASFDYIDN